MDDQPPALSFSLLDARIEAMPDGPASILKTPRIIYWLDILGSIAIVFGLLPFLLVQFLTQITGSGSLIFWLFELRSEARPWNRRP